MVQRQHSKKRLVRVVGQPLKLHGLLVILVVVAAATADQSGGAEGAESNQDPSHQRSSDQPEPRGQLAGVRSHGGEHLQQGILQCGDLVRSELGVQLLRRLPHDRIQGVRVAGGMHPHRRRHRHQHPREQHEPSHHIHGQRDHHAGTAVHAHAPALAGRRDQQQDGRQEAQGKAHQSVHMLMVALHVLAGEAGVGLVAGNIQPPGLHRSRKLSLQSSAVGGRRQLILALHTVHVGEIHAIAHTVAEFLDFCFGVTNSSVNSSR
mmetsp:Transcript_42294/g.92314  ORF Transcript_42294/g.92314 Transcript_42294/m.92314 type:complete len:263 (-) Transcript_42294:232-1020(-)